MILKTTLILRLSTYESIIQKRAQIFIKKFTNQNILISSPFYIFWLLSKRSFHGNKIILHLRQREVKRIEMVERNALFLFFLHSVLINYEWISFVEDNKRALHNTYRLSALHYDMIRLQTFPFVSFFFSFYSNYAKDLFIEKN